jgi:hypothetical protein
MFYTSENNWYIWKYGDLEPFSRQSGNLPFTTSFSKFTGEVKSFKEELSKAATSAINFSKSNISILFSGGLYSELIIRSFLEVNYKPKVYIIQYEKNYNLYDVNNAIKICSKLNVPYKIIDFNLKKFYENSAEKYSELSQIDKPEILPYCEIIEKIDEFLIMGFGSLIPIRISNDYAKKEQWLNVCLEYSIGLSKFLKYINKPSIAEWFKWTPGLVISYMKLEWFNNLINDKFIGKLGPNSTKLLGFREIYPDIIDRKKQNEFEDIFDVILEFEEFLYKKYNGLIFRNFQKKTYIEIYNEIRG